MVRHRRTNKSLWGSGMHCWITGPGPETLVLCSILLLAGCGGGGSTAPVPEVTPVTAFPVGRMLAQLATQGGAWSVSNAQEQASLTVEYRPLSTGGFIRQQRLQTPSSAHPVVTQDRVMLDATNPLFQVSGWIDNFENPAVITESTAIPDTARVATSGMLASGRILILDNGLNTGDIGLTHGLSYSWSLQTATAASADMCLTAWNSGDFYGTFSTDCFRINAQGQVQGFMATLGFHAKGIDGQTVYQ